MVVKKALLCLLTACALGLSVFAAEGPRKFLWAELIAFDNTKPDFGVEEYLSRSAFKPDGISLLLVEAEVFEKHVAGLPSDVVFPERACSYWGRPYNCERKRQKWTAHQLRGLVGELNKHGLETYASFFEWGSQDLTGLTPAGDEPYVDFYIRQTCAFLKDYGFTGLHAADGFAHPRKDLAHRGVPLAKRFAEAGKWGAFWRKAGAAFKQAGFKTYLNSCWKRDPYEALIRYGYDYRPVNASDITGWVIEGSCGVGEMEGWTKTAESDMDNLTAMLLRLSPTFRGKEAVVMFCVKDDLEQYHCLYHAPTQAEAAAFIIGGVLCDERRATQGVLACLSDGIASGDWVRLDKMWRSAYADEPAEAMGVRVVWSDRAFDTEARLAVEQGFASSYTLLSGLIHRGAVIGGAVRLETALAKPDMPVLVLNPGCFPKDELEALRKRGAACVEFGYGRDDFTDHPVTAEPQSWLDPLVESRPNGVAFSRCRRAVNAFSPVTPADEFDDLVVSGFRGTDGVWRVSARNNRQTYVNAELEIRRSVGSVGILSDYPSMPVQNMLKAKVPPKGVVALKLENLIRPSEGRQKRKE